MPQCATLQCAQWCNEAFFPFLVLKALMLHMPYKSRDPHSIANKERISKALFLSEHF